MIKQHILYATFFLLLLSLTHTLFAEKIDYWNTQRKGANVFPNLPKAERFKDAAEDGILIIRLAPNKWLNGRDLSERGDFLLGPKDSYTEIVDKDLKYLVHVLDDADKAGVKIVLTMLSLPGSRWLQHNKVNGKYVQQYGLWKDFKYHKQSAHFWKDLAKKLKDHPAIVGYNIINEPCPERAHPPMFRDWYTMDYKKWYKSIKNTPADLNLFYKTVIQAIREVDNDTPIILDSVFYSNPYALQILDPKCFNDKKIIYSIHHYSPSRFLYTDNPGKYKYPGKIPTGELDAPDEKDAQKPYAPVKYWHRKQITSYFKIVNKWMKIHKIQKNRIYVGEFGGHRQASGIVQYFADLISFMNKNKWHWTFYAYREDDGFQIMDYELGTGELLSPYWECSKKYNCKDAGVYKTNPLWKVIIDGLN